MPPTLQARKVGGQVDYAHYVGNLARLAVEIVNGDAPSELRREMFRQHQIDEPDTERLAAFLPGLRAAVRTAAQGGSIQPVNSLLEQHPPMIRVADTGGEGHP